jgi:hypothetical protein
MAGLLLSSIVEQGDDFALRISRSAGTKPGQHKPLQDRPDAGIDRSQL